MRKYRNVPVVLDGLRFDSKAEAGRWAELKLLEKAGQISDLKRQVTIPCEINGQIVTKYIADFTYTEAGRHVVEDLKGVETALFRLKAKIVKACHNIDITLVKRRAA